MKLFTLFVAILFCTGFISCVDRMDINDIKDGTPTRIDTVVKRNYIPPVKKEPAKETETGEEEK